MIYHIVLSIILFFFIVTTPLFAELGVYENTHKVLDPEEFVSVVISEDSGYTQNPDTGCKYMESPVVIRLPKACGNSQGTYCYGGIKCRVDSADSINAHTFCKANRSGKCPDPVECYRENSSNLQNKLKISQVKEHGGIQRNTLLPEDEAQRTSFTQNLSRQQEIQKQNEEELQRWREEAGSDVRKKAKKKAKSGGSIFGGVFNFFRCLFKSPNCNKPQKSSGGSSSRSKATIIDDTRGR